MLCLCTVTFNVLSFYFIDMASAAFIEPLPVIEFVAQLLGKDVLSKPLSDSDRIKVQCSSTSHSIKSLNVLSIFGDCNRSRRVSGE